MKNLIIFLLVVISLFSFSVKKDKEVIYINLDGKEVKDMDVVYATLIIHGLRTFQQVPGKLLKERVKSCLEELGFPELAM